ncbi:hypothetical protein SEA_FIZZLES_96 [Microbacterium phage Fizzles]|nr:hypothetical protein SEA_FIZZLES_96 [Microbacterium phage Fizzles]
MGAHNAATLAVARDRAQAVVNLLREYPGTDHVAEYWRDEIENILENGVTEGTLRAWMERHDGEPIDTLQTTIKVVLKLADSDRNALVPTIEPQRPWAPGSRRVDATRAACVLLNGSRRDYAGVTTFLVTERGYIGFAKFGDDAVQMLVYVR